MKTATLTNLDRAEYGTVSVDLDLLRKQIAWLEQQFVLPFTEAEYEARAGIINLLEGILDLTDPQNEEGG
jgi:hypothetical protein